jgi:hypothetical protein
LAFRFFFSFFLSFFLFLSLCSYCLHSEVAYMALEADM